MLHKQLHMRTCHLQGEYNYISSKNRKNYKMRKNIVKTIKLSKKSGNSKVFMPCIVLPICKEHISFMTDDR